MLVGTHLPRREAVLVSDFQRTGWRGDDLDPLPEGTVLHRVNVGSDSAPNLAVVHADLTASPRVWSCAPASPGSGISAPVRTRATLELDGRAAGSRDVALEADGIVTVAFDPATVGEAGARGVVRLESADSLAVDDSYRFVASGERPLRVLLDPVGRRRALPPARAGDQPDAARRSQGRVLRSAPRSSPLPTW